MKSNRSLLQHLLLVAALGLGLVGITGCDKGAFERAGEKTDRAIDEAGDAAKEAGDKVEDAVDPDK